VTDAAGAAQGVRREVEGVVKSQIERLLQDMNVTSREDFEALREMTVAAMEANARLELRVKALEAALEARTGSAEAAGVARAGI
jgi:BMFP domain-containing protein YqiC